MSTDVNDTPTIAEATATLTAVGSMFEMEDAEVFGVRLRTWKHAPGSLRALLELSRLHGDKPFIVYEDEVLTFEEHFRAAAHLATILVERFGIEKGDRVAIVMRNFPEWSIAFWAAAAAGAVVVPLNAWWTADELEYGLQDSGARVAFVDAERLERLQEVRAGLDVQLVVARGPGDGAEEWAAVLGDVPADATLPDVELAPEDLATIFYT
jgi:long-chain acyl-CoA synthetase